MITKVNEVILKKRILIFLAICFGLTWIYDITVIRNISAVKDGPFKQVLSSLGMYFPLIAHLCTRIITKEKFKLSGDESLMLTINYKKSNWLFVAMLLPYIYSDIGNAILVISHPKLLLSKNMCSALGISAGSIASNVGKKIIMSLMFVLVAIGEESGWRGYMMPKLMKLYGTGKAVIVGGIVWGLWHMPLICMGHNFGTEYPGFPYLGIFLMTIMCICSGSLMTFVTIKSKSIWPAAVMHAVNNSNPGIMALLLNAHELGKMNTILMAIIKLIPICIMGILCIYVMVKYDVFRDTDRNEGNI